MQLGRHLSIKSLGHICTHSIWVEEMGADLRCKCTSIFRTRAQVGLHRQIKQLLYTHIMNVSKKIELKRKFNCKFS